MQASNILCYWTQIVEWVPMEIDMMAACHGNTFHITGPLCGESIGHQFDYPYKAPVMQSFNVSLKLAWASC